MDNLPICGVCNINKSVGVASLPFAAYSEAFCRECLVQEAYPLWTLEFLFFDVGDGDDDNLVEDVKDYKSFYNGKYIDWEEVKTTLIWLKETKQIRKDE